MSINPTFIPSRHYRPLALLLGLALLMPHLVLPQIPTDGTVKSFQKISDTAGNFTATLDNEDFFGFSVATLGDLDGDGIADLAVGAYDNDGGTDRGAVYVLFMQTDGTVKSFQKISDIAGNFAAILDDSDNFGCSVAALGDLDGDGVTDLAVGAHYDDDGGTDRGAVYILFMQTNGTVKSYQKISDIEGNFNAILDDVDYFGHSVAALGDLDGDGVTDLAVGARQDDDGGPSGRGAVYVLFLQTNGTVKSFQKISATAGNFAGTLSSGDQFGSSVTALGDLDGDEVTDLTVGAYGDDGGGLNRGAVYVLFLQTDGTVKSFQKISEAEGNFTASLDNYDVFGRSLAALGDLDGDGIPDCAVGANEDDDGGTNRGAVYILFLRTDGTVKSLQKISDTEGNFTATLENSDHFGISVAALGDLDGDGVSDLAVGAYADDDGGTWRGAVYVLFLQDALSSGLVAYYPFNGNANDESGNSNHGTVNGATLTTDRFGSTNSTYSFDGVDDYIEIPDSETLNPANEITLHAWIKINNHKASPAANNIIVKDNVDNGDRDYLLFTGHAGSGDQAGLAIWTTESGSGIYGGTLALNNWHSLVGTYDGNTTRLYIDGSLVQSVSQLGSLINTNNPLYIGKTNEVAYSRFFDGLIDDIRIYNRALTEAEIQALYHEGGWPVEVATSTQYISGTGEVDFPGTDVTMDFTSQSGADTIEVQAFPTAPSGTPPAGTALAADRYWIITHTGSGDFSVELTLDLGPGTFSTQDMNYPARLCLLQRDTGGTLPWEIESYGASITDSTITFTGLTGFSQFAIGRTTDIAGPSISSDFRRVANPDDIIEVDASVSDPSGISSMMLHYLAGSGSDFTPTDMNRLNDTTYRVGISVASPVIRGLAYFLIGIDSVGNVTITDTTSIPVDFPAGTFTTSMSVTAFSDGFPKNKWRLISIPCDIGDTSVISIIQSELGESPSDETWKIFRYTGPGRDDYIPAGRFTSGESYFLKQIVTEGPLHFTLGAGRSADHTGWSQAIAPRRWRFIASPYPFPVSVIADQGVFKGPYAFGAFGSGRQEGWSIGQVQTTFRPWGGYIIYNNTDQTQTLVIRPPGLAKAILPKSTEEQIAGWLVQLTAEGERYYDTGNVIGRIPGATEGLDDYDHPEPPYMEGYASLTTENPDWPGTFGIPRTSDIRSDEETNGVWDLDLRTRGETGPIAITYEIRGAVPSGEQVVLLDLVQRRISDLTAGERPKAVTDYSEKLPYNLKVIAGTPDYVQGTIEDVLAQLPEEFALSQNYPNPFNPSTTIEYALPKPARVSLRVYNLLGQETATLVNDWQDMGYHNIVWAGRDQAGRNAATGVYFAVLHADGHVLTRKMALLK